MTKHSGILLAYYSGTGNTRKIAYQLHTYFDTCLYRIVPQQAYPRHWYEIRQRVAEDSSGDHSMALSVPIRHLHEYHTVFLGFPNWWNELPLPVEQFLRSHDFSGKTILPFSTYRTQTGVATENVRMACDGATVLNALEVPDVLAKTAQSFIGEWIRKTPYTQILKRRVSCICDRSQII